MSSVVVHRFGGVCVVVGLRLQTKDVAGSPCSYHGVRVGKVTPYHIWRSGLFQRSPTSPTAAWQAVGGLSDNTGDSLSPCVVIVTDTVIASAGISVRGTYDPCFGSNLRVDPKMTRRLGKRELWGEFVLLSN